jgi:nicotinamidase-related amidase
MRLLEREDSVLLVIDAQERFYGPERADVDRESLHLSFERAGWLTAAAGALGVAVLVTEEDAEQNGPTDTLVAQHLPEGTPVLDKRYFGAPANPDIMAALDDTGRGTVVIVGLETDVCVAHTALLLLDRGWRVAVAEDCLFSPGEAHDAGLRRLRDSGVEMLTAKAVFYDWVRGLAELDTVCATSETVRQPPGFHL